MLAHLLRAHSSVALLLLATGICHGASTAASEDYAKWEAEIQAFEAEDEANPPPAHAILFIGSSSIRLWKTLTSDFDGIPVINRGFGGSQMSDSLAFADRIVLPYRPKQIVVYAGENDLAAGKGPEQVLKDFQVFVMKVWAALPETRIAYISMKPSPSRWRLADQIRTGNRLIAEFTRSNSSLQFIDVFNPMLGSDGKPREELFVKDQLHLNRTGYELWAAAVRPHLVRN